MSSELGRILRSRVVVPVVQPPIDNGAVFLCDGRIEQVGRWEDLKHLSSDVEDLGEGALIPGLVNAHCHLDFTQLAGQIPTAESFSAWIKEIIGRCSQWTDDQWRDSWAAGMEQLRENGVTTVGNIETRWNLLPDLLQDSPIRVCSFLEMTGLLAGRDPNELVSEAMALRQELDDPELVGLSPHSPYAVVKGLLEETASMMMEQEVQGTIHVAESAEEWDMFKEGSGGLFDVLKEMGRDNSDCGDKTPIEVLSSAGLLRPEMLLTHANYLSETDIDLIGESGSSVVHCPSCFSYFRHGEFAYEKLIGQGVNIALGTDSLASAEPDESGDFELNLFTEMRRFSFDHPNVAPEQVLRMATLNGAQALGLDDEVGCLAEDAEADILFIETDAGHSLEEAVEYVVQEVWCPSKTMVGGRWLEDEDE